MSLPKYSKYNSSGVEWMGDIPAHWGVSQSRRLFKVRSEPAQPGDQMLTASQKYGVLPQAEFVLREGRRVVEVIQGVESLKHVEPDDFIISMRSFQGGIEWCRLRGSTSFHYVMLTPVKWVWPAFFSYLLKSAPYIQALRRTTDLIRDGQELRFSNFAQVPLPVVPLDEQKTIATFLDYETTKIDALISEQEKLIALLAEKRQATISHAVTKGLNPNAPVRDSGVAWLGKVPAHWKVLSLKHLVSVPITDGPHETPSFPDEGIPFVSAEAVSGGFINFEKIRGYISAEDHRRYSEKYKPQLHDIYMVKSGATTGVTAIVESETEFNIWSPLAAIRCDKQKADPYFVLAALRSRNFQEGVALNWSFGTQQNIGMGVLGDLPVALPPLNEQYEIAAYLALQTPKLSILSIAAERTITLLKERRSALIAAAVTGQIDVREGMLRNLAERPEAIAA